MFEKDFFDKALIMILTTALTFLVVVASFGLLTLVIATSGRIIILGIPLFFLMRFIYRTLLRNLP